MPILIVTTTVINDITCYTRTSSRVQKMSSSSFPFLFQFFFFFFNDEEWRGEVRMGQSRSRSSACGLTTAPYSAQRDHRITSHVARCMWAYARACIMYVYVYVRVSGRVCARCQIANAADYNLARERCVDISPPPPVPVFFSLFFHQILSMLLNMRIAVTWI